MDEVIVRVFRVLACRPRLQILSCLAGATEVAPTRLAEEVGRSVELVCMHLRHLVSVGLIQRRRSGVWCYCVSKSPYSDKALSGKLASWLRAILRHPERTLKNCRLKQVCNAPEPDPVAQLQGLLLDAATAFTNVRRVQILRWLTNGTPVSIRALSEEFHMSESAVSRHTTKLVRRGYAISRRQGRNLTFELAPDFATPIHAEMFEIVHAEWQKGELQT